MALKGHTKIELIDVNTGEVEVHEDDNMITNALNEFMRSYGTWGGNSVTTIDNPFWSDFLGGIYLFDSVLEENADNYYPPAGVTMIGNGAFNVSNGGNVTELGTYNTTESGVQTDGSIKMVYDWSTSQANGTIRSVCLTSRYGGQAGEGNAQSKIKINDNNITNSKQGEQVEKSAPSNSVYAYVLYGNYADDALYYVPREVFNNSTSELYWRNSGKIIIKKAKLNAKSVDIRCNSALDIENSVINEYQIDIPDFDTIKSYMANCNNEISQYSVLVSKDNSYFLFHNDYKVTAGSYFYIVKVDKNMQATMYKVTNNTGDSLYVAYYRNFSAIIEDDYFVTLNVSQKSFYKIKITDSTNTAKIESYSDSANRIYWANGKKIYGYTNSNSSKYFVIDAVLNKCLPMNGGFKDEDSGSYAIYNNNFNIADKKGIFTKLSNSTYGAKMSLFKMINYLATINNLSEPVTKTSSKTMKITYTLTIGE